MQTSSSTTENQVNIKYKRGTLIEGIPPILCIFCDFTTSIEFDLELHLYEAHRLELVKLPIGKGNMDYRIEYAIKNGKRLRNALAGLPQKTKDKLVTITDGGKDISTIPSEIRANIGLDFILDHLEDHYFHETS